MYPNMRQDLKQSAKWVEHAHGICIGELNVKADNWEKERRIVIVRQQIDIRPKAPGKLLFPDDEIYSNYRYTAYVTNSQLSSVLVWELYRQRGDAENRIKDRADAFGWNMISKPTISVCRISMLQKQHSEQ